MSFISQNEAFRIYATISSTQNKVALDGIHIIFPTDMTSNKHSLEVELGVLFSRKSKENELLPFHEVAQFFIDEGWWISPFPTQNGVEVTHYLGKRMIYL